MQDREWLLSQKDWDDKTKEERKEENMKELVQYSGVAGADQQEWEKKISYYQASLR